jgi:hypothetical protein
MAQSDGGIGNVTPNTSLVHMAMSYSRSRMLCAAARLGVADALGDEVRKLNTEIGDVNATIRLSPDGPLLVKNVQRFFNWLGEPLPSRPSTNSRCGGAKCPLLSTI